MKYCTICKSKYEDGVSFCPTDGEVLEDDPSSIVGTVLDGQYQIESLLGKGGMGAVYLARHILLGDRVAIKILPPEVRNNADWLRRFRREGQAARRLRHANAVAVHDLRTSADGTIYMVMEYVEGQTLDAELKQRGRFTPAEAFEILEPIMSVLNTAHSMGVVHRDLKPENIMIAKGSAGKESSVKLLDLGIAKMREIAGESTGTTELTMAGQVLGTPYYMSPEQWGEPSRDGNPEIDGRADIYSLGLVAYQMISGKRPYSATTLHELRRDHIHVTPPPLREKMPDVSQSFSDAIDRAISKDRDDRQATAGELAGQLRSAVIAGGEGTPSVDRTLPDIPHAQSSHAHTRGAAGDLETKTDVNAPTIITVDSIPTSPPSTGLPPKPLPVSPAAPPPSSVSPAYAPVADLGSSVTVVQPPRTPASEVAEKKARGKSVALIGAGALLLILAVVGGGGFFAVNWLKAKSPVQSGDAANGITTPANPATLAPVEVGRYWLEVLPDSSEPIRVAGAVPLTSGQAFKFHFQFEEGGYLYIVGPGDGNRPMAFLTLYPAEISGLDSNLVTKAEDFSFPNGIEHWMELDKKPGTETYTIIFSSSPITEPAFLREPVTRKPLSDSEQAALASFLAKHKTSDPVTELNDKDGKAPFVAVKLPASDVLKESGVPIAFEVRIQHK
ncbi:MAG: serine/threonine protein kinase [Pyrinomonadaceae bacterium]|nr:serine/threonine protein kinase [Pyrinomonadaceae bacterium]